jgi:hypothetical protein
MHGSKICLLVLLAFSVADSGFGQIDSIQQQPESTRTTPVQPVIIQPETTRQQIQDTPRRVRYRPIIDSASVARANLLRDSLRTDSLQKAKMAVRAAVIDTSSYKKYFIHPYLPLDQTAVYMLTDRRSPVKKDELFYLMAGVVFCLAFIRAGFPKYFRNLFVVFFQTNIRQKQSRDQLLQDNFASLLINLLFFISAGLYITLLIQNQGWTTTPFWILALASVVALVLIYLGKYLFLLFAGWVFNAKEAAGSYVFLVFLVNKIMGVLLIPFLLILAFSATEVVNVSLLVSLIMIGLLFLYRYFVSFNAIRSRLKVNLLHFFLYLCAVEVLPLLLIYKVLVNYFEGSL